VPRPSTAELELVAVLLSGRPERRQSLARSLLAEAGSLWALAHFSAAALHELGLGREEAARLVAAAAFGRRALVEPASRAPLREPADAYRLLAPELVGIGRERFLALVLDIKNRPRAMHCVTEGSIDGCPVDPREIFAPAIRERASAVLVAHNHPSGDPCPSAEDLALTQRLVAAGEVLGIPILDHLIVAGIPGAGQSGYVSLAARGVVRPAVNRAWQTPSPAPWSGRSLPPRR